MKIRLVLAVACVAFSMGGARDVARAAITVAQQVLPTQPLTLFAAGKAHIYNVEVARTSEQQEAGLMFRRSMPRDHGMIFPFVPARAATFWMENTILPLDLIFILPDNTVGRVAANAQPYSRDLIDSLIPVVAVLELNAGEASRIGLRPGDKVSFNPR